MAALVTTKSHALKLREYQTSFRRPLAFDFETTGTDWTSDKIVGLAIADGFHEWYITMERGLTPSELGEVLRGWFDRPDQLLIAHNAKFDTHFLRYLGVRLSQPPLDTMGLAQLYNEMAPLGLKEQAFFVFDRRPRKWDKTFLKWPVEEKAAYAAADVRNTFDLAAWYVEGLKSQDLWQYFTKFMLPLPLVAVQMELSGWTLDKDRVVKYGETIQKKLDEALLDICARTPGLENPNSTKQLVEAFSELGAIWLESEYTERKQRSTGEEVLKRWVEGGGRVGELAQDILDYRKDKKLQGYITGSRGLLKRLGTDGRIHPDWRIFGTFTGRWSCSNPNLQNIPKYLGDDESEEDPRSWFVAGPGNVLIVADLEQAELRILAALSQDPRLLDVFARNQDVHRVTASIVLDVPYVDVTAAQRHIGKTINFATVYGGGTARLASIGGVPVDQAEQFLRRFYREFRGVAQWQADIITQARLNGVVHTAFGRPRRPLLFRVEEMLNWPEMGEVEPGDDRLALAGLEVELRKKGMTRELLRKPYNASKIEYLKHRAQRQAVNASIQGSVGDIINRALIALTDMKVKVLAQIHDEIIVEVKKEQAEEVAELIAEVLHTEVDGVELDGNIKITQNWSEK